MPRIIHVFRQPERFIAGTVGEPGDRSFYLQAIQEARTVSVLLEKQQVSVLADRISALLQEVARRFGSELPDVTEEEVDESVVLDDTEEGPDALGVFLSPPQAKAYADRAERVVSAGRPPCPLCAEPLDPEGHVCMRLNGYHQRSPVED